MTLPDALDLAEERGDAYATGTEGWNWWRAWRDGGRVHFELWQTWWRTPAWGQLRTAPVLWGVEVRG